MKNNELSKIIKEVREEKSLKIENLSVSTKIPVKYIEALENQEYKKIPEGPYVKLYFSKILAELDIDLNNYKLKPSLNLETTEEEIPVSQFQEKDTKEKIQEILDAKKEVVKQIEEDVFEEKQEQIIQKKESPKGLILFVILIVLGLGTFFFVDNLESKNEERDFLQKQKQDSIFVADSLNRVKKELAIKDSLRAIEVADSIKLAEENFKKEFKEKNADNRKKERSMGWFDPAYKEINDKDFAKIYGNKLNPKISIKAVDGYVKIKLFSQKNKWWKKINFRDSLDLHIPEASSIHFYNCNLSEVSYKGEKVDFKKYSYAKYLFKYSGTYSLQKAYY